MPDLVEKIGVSMEKLVEGLKRFVEGLIYALFLIWFPGVFLLLFGFFDCFNTFLFFLGISGLSALLLALLCSVSIRFLALMYSLSIACIPSLVISLIAGYFSAEQTSLLPGRLFIVNFWVAIPVYIMILILVFPWVWIYLLHKHGLISKKPAPKGVVDVMRNEFADTVREIKRFGRRGEKQ